MPRPPRPNGRRPRRSTLYSGTVALCATLVLVLTGCGEDGVDLPATSTTGGATETTATTPGDGSDDGPTTPEPTAPDVTQPGGEDSGSEPTTTAAEPTTTQSPETTTATDAQAAEALDADEDETPWGWIVLILAAVLALVVVLVVVLRRRGDDTQDEDWWRRAGQACEDARSVAALIPDPAGSTPGPDDAARAQAVSTRTRDVEQRIAALASTAPDDQVGGALVDVQDCLSNLEFTADADRLLRTGETPPTAEQLRESGDSFRQRRAAFEAAVADARALVTPHLAPTGQQR